MIHVSVSELNSSMGELLGAFNSVTSGKLMPNMQVALKASLELMAEKWRAYLTKGEEFPGSNLLKRPMNRMANRIRSDVAGDGLGGKVTINAPWSEWMEKGAKAFDMKQTHPYGNKSRVGRDGTPYLIIPFRHGTPGSERSPMPDVIYKYVRAMVKAGQFEPSKVVNAQDHPEQNYRGKPIMRASYQWGGRLSGLHPQFRNLEGMVYFHNKSTKGGSLNSSYMTFRIISAKSPEGSWIIPEKPMVIPHVVEATRETVAELLQAGIRRDLGI